MSNVFLDVLNGSIAAGWLVLGILTARLLLKKAPRWLICGLWALVAVRLLLPGTIQSPVSLVPSAQTIPPASMYDHAPVIDSGVELVDEIVNPIYTESFRTDGLSSINPLQVWTAVGANIWVLGMLAMLLWAMVSWLRIRRQVREGIPLEGSIWLCDRIDTPFIFGFFAPKIYLPSALSCEVRSHVIAHERAHLARRDHWWKPLGFALLTVHWFNPLMWAAYILLCRDIELACDERVIRDMGLDEKKGYSAALLQCSVSPRMIAACPLAFGEVGVKQRIQSVLHYKKPAFWIILIALIVLLVLAVGFLTDPIPNAETEPPSGIMESEDNENPLGMFLLVEDVTARGLTLVCTQDGTPLTHLMTGSPYFLERWEDGSWVSLPFPEGTAWTMEGIGVPIGNSIQWRYDWTRFWGELPPGQYRISKDFTGTLPNPGVIGYIPEDVDQTCYAEFTIE